MMDIGGYYIRIPVEVDEMSDPVRCYCGQWYDLSTVEVTHRYADCSMWNAPCCGRQSDDRQWKSLPDYTPLGKLLERY